MTTTLTDAPGDRQVLDGTLARSQNQWYLKVDGSTALWGPVEVTGDAVVGDRVCVAVSQQGTLYRVWPGGGVADGGGSAILSGTWNWTTSVTDAASGRIGLNTTAWSTATTINISKTSGASVDVSNALAKLATGHVLYIQQSDDATIWGRYDVTGPAVDKGAYVSVPARYSNSQGAVPANNRQMSVMVSIGAGGTADKNYVHTQGAPSATWTVTHNLNKLASVTVVDSGDTAVIPDIHYDSASQVTLTFGSPTTGKAYCN